MRTSHRAPSSRLRPRQTRVSHGPSLNRRRLLMQWMAVLAILLATLGAVTGIYFWRGHGSLLVASFPGGTELITNERAYFSPHAVGVHTSPTWIVSSGSLFSYDGTGWTGIPDSVAPNDNSSNSTDSAVFRAITRRADFTNVTVSFELRVLKLVSTKRTPATAYDGVHVFLRYQNPQELYAVSVYRRDGIVGVKEKTPGGPSNGGTYSTLAQMPYEIPLRVWVPIHVTIVTLVSGSVRINLDINGHQELTTTVPPSRSAPILGAGRVGLRGDNCEFFFRDFTVSAAAP
jgi:hypothetical protein